MSMQNSFQRFHDEKEHPHHHERIHSVAQVSHHHKPSDNYNPLAMPPDWEFAKRHAKARRTAKEKPLDDNTMQEVCPCCGYELDREDIGMCDPALELAFLGSGYPLFYNYVKYSIILLVTLALIESIPNIYIYTQGDFCNKTEVEQAKIVKYHNEHPNEAYQEPCAKFNLLTMSMANVINKPFPDWQIYLQIAIQALVMIELMIFRYHQRKIDIDVDKQLTTPADYSIVVKNIPQGMTGQEATKELKEKIQHHAIFGKEIEVKKIVPVFRIHKLEEKEDEIKSLVKKKQETLLKNGSNYQDQEVVKIDHEIEKMEEELEEVNEEIMNDPHCFAGIAFISFNSEQDKQMVLQDNQVSQWDRFKLYFSGGASKKYIKNNNGNDVLYWKDRHLYIEQAPEPNDVDWEFIHETTNNRLKARLKSNFQQLLLQLFCFVTIYVISYAQSMQIDKAMDAVLEDESGADTRYFLVRSISVLISAIIVLLNKFWLGGQVHHIVDHEKWSTKTKLNISFGTKLTLALFCNTALITLAVEIITFGNYYGVGGMITTESMVFVFNALVPPLAWLVDPWHLSKKSRRKAEMAKGDKSVLTQEEANDLCEDTIYINGKRYADMMKTMWFTFFYSPIVPFGTLCSIFGLFIYYWIDKYNVVKRRTVKETISKDLTFQMIELLEFIVCFHAFGDFMFKKALFGIYEKKDLILLIAAALYNLAPLQGINELIFPIEQTDEDALYDDVVHDFDNDYDRENPVHKKKALEKWIEGRKQKTEKQQTLQQKQQEVNAGVNNSFNINQQ